jgi:hypothetical protein
VREERRGDRLVETYAAATEKFVVYVEGKAEVFCGTGEKRIGRTERVVSISKTRSPRNVNIDCSQVHGSPFQGMNRSRRPKDTTKAVFGCQLVLDLTYSGGQGVWFVKCRISTSVLVIAWIKPFSATGTGRKGSPSCCVQMQQELRSYLFC